MIFHMPEQNIVADRCDMPKHVCKVSQGKSALPLKQKREDGRESNCVGGAQSLTQVLTSIVILPLCQDPHLSLLTGYACAFPPISLPSPHPLHCLVPHHTESRFLYLPCWGLCLSPTCYFSSPCIVILQTSFLLSTNPVILYFSLPFSPFSIDLFHKKWIFSDW